MVKVKFTAENGNAFGRYPKLSWTEYPRKSGNGTRFKPGAASTFIIIIVLLILGRY